MIKSILVNLSVGATRVAAMDYAISVAGAFEAHLMGTAFAYEPILPPTIMGGIPSDFIQAQREESEQAATETIKLFEERTRRAGISAESTMIVATLAEAADRFGKLARRADLSIVEQTKPDALATEDLIIEAGLFQSGRPVIVVPYIQKSGLSLNHVMIAWDGSRNAARAIGDAMPLLHQAKAIEIVIIATDQEFGELPGADLAQHLARHGLKIDLRRIVAADSDVPSTLLSHAADVSADLLVMGGFGHSRFREFFFGGTTRGILDTMTLPVLMSH